MKSGAMTPRMLLQVFLLSTLWLTAMTSTPTPLPTTPTATSTLPSVSIPTLTTDATATATSVDLSQITSQVFLPLVSKSSSKQNVLSYLANLPDRQDDRVISGQHLGYGIWDVSSAYQKDVVGLHDVTGKWVGMIGTTYGLGATATQIASGNRLLIEYWNAGGLITIDHHPNNPWTGGSPWDLRNRNLVELITPGTAVYNTWMAELDKVAAGLAELRDAGVVVLWRPFHEMTYTHCFWWDSGAHGGEWRDGRYYPVSEPFINMWRHMFNYFTYEKGLDNLLWVYCAAGDTDHYTDVDALYPGGEYVDIVSLDIYDDSLATRGDGYSKLVATGKPFGFAEIGPSFSDGADGSWDTMTIINSIKNRYPRAIFWQSWASWENTAVALVDNRNASALLNDPWVITRDEID